MNQRDWRESIDHNICKKLIFKTQPSISRCGHYANLFVKFSRLNDLVPGIRFIFPYLGIDPATIMFQLFLNFIPLFDGVDKEKPFSIAEIVVNEINDLFSVAEKMNIYIGEVIF